MIQSICKELENLEFQYHLYEGCKGKRIKIRVLTESPESINELMWIQGLAKMHGLVAYWHGNRVEIRPKIATKRGRPKKDASTLPMP